MKRNKTEDINRLETLLSYELLDTLPEKIYDDITRLAATICETDISLITLIDDKRQFFKSRYGIDMTQTPIETSFCNHMIIDGTRELIVEDTLKDSRFSENRLVIDKPGIRFYAGVALTSTNGMPLGALCVIHNKPKQLSGEQKNQLQTLANQVSQLFELRKIRLEQIRKKEEMDRIMDASMDIIFTLDKKGNFKSVNKACKRIWGYTPKELHGRNFLDFIIPEDKRATAQLIPSKGSKKIDNFENSFQHRDMYPVPMLYSANWDNKEGIIYCIGKDASEKKKAERELVYSERRFKTLVQEGSDLIAILDTNAVYTYVSPTSKKVLQMEPEEFIGTNAFDYIHPEDREEVYARFMDVMQTSQIKIKPFRFRNKNGDWRWIESVATNQIQESSLKGIVINSRDVTNRIHYLEAIENQNKKLKEIAWNQSHVVRSPVARLMGLIDLIQEEQLEGFEKKKVLNSIISSAHEIDKVIKKNVANTAAIIDIEKIK